MSVISLNHETKDLLAKIYSQITVEEYLSVVPKEELKKIVGEPQLDLSKLTSEDIYKLFMDLISKGLINLETLIGKVTVQKLMAMASDKFKIEK